MCRLKDPEEDVIPSSLMPEIVRTGKPMMLDIMQFGDGARRSQPLKRVSAQTVPESGSAPRFGDPFRKPR